jgi:hypothetical protein
MLIERRCREDTEDVKAILQAHWGHVAGKGEQNVGADKAIIKKPAY